MCCCTKWGRNFLPSNNRYRDQSNVALSWRQGLVSVLHFWQLTRATLGFLETCSFLSWGGGGRGSISAPPLQTFEPIGGERCARQGSYSSHWKDSKAVLKFKYFDFLIKALSAVRSRPGQRTKPFFHLLWSAADSRDEARVSFDPKLRPMCFWSSDHLGLMPYRL